eukprot:TRINITY_DN2563_c0_g1_i1.p1 TRINITY_DN2563_c0_g1~~TRINITY_DN2563_c0_g1_i1.p1  ORF type:complete len:489 (-),score=60.54 TRINITY_DN2563_c0_g1_i1:993-2459(-)
MALVVVPAISSAVLRINQGSELVPKFGGWLRSNNRGTDSNLIISGSEEVMRSVKDALQGRQPGSAAHVRLSLRYEDNQEEVDMISRHQHPDRISCIPTSGGHKAAVNITKHGRIELGSQAELTTMRFVNVGEPCANYSGEPGSFSLSIGIKFSTNITSTYHGGRTMFWRAELQVSCPSGTFSTQGDSPAFEYHPREPKGGDAPKLDLVLSDGRPGDLLILNGDRLGSVYKDLQCKISLPSQTFTLQREILDSKPTSCFIARLPSDLPPCSDAKVSVVVNQSTSNELKFVILSRDDAPALPTVALPSVLHSPPPSLETSPLQALGLDNPLSGGPVTSRSSRQEERRGRRVGPYSENPSRPAKQDISLILAPSASQWRLPPSSPAKNVAPDFPKNFAEFPWPTANRPSLSRQSSEELSLRLASFINTPSAPLSRSNSNELGWKGLTKDDTCRMDLGDFRLPLSRCSLPLSRCSSEDFLLADDFLLAAGSV